MLPHKKSTQLPPARSLIRAPPHTDRYSPYPGPANRPSQQPSSHPTGPLAPTLKPVIDQNTPHTHIGAASNHQKHSNQRRRDGQDDGRAQKMGGIFEKAHDFVMYNPVAVLNNFDSPDNFMVEFAKHAMPGAAFDDFDRSPPPRCHPGTRLAVLQRAQDFFTDPQHDKKMLWIVGPAGVGKSAIMQSLAENVANVNSDVVLGASLFFSVNGRADGSKTVTTLAYQIAVQDPSYRRFIQNEVTTDPTLFRKALPTQFNKFIIEPFIGNAVGSGHKRFLILIDGLDECNGDDPQCEILDLISSFCIQCPSAPLIWIIASRPEPHITTFFARDNVVSAYDKETISIDSHEACADVERYLRDELGKLRTKYPEMLASFSRWPRERDFLKLSAASGGLFAFASTAVRFINDPHSGDPESQLKEFLEVIRDIPSRPRDADEHPMARLDALYSRIFSRIPQRTLVTTKKLLLGMDLTVPSQNSHKLKFAYLCNWLGLAPNVAYGALHQLHSVLNIPTPKYARKSTLRPLHKSFHDYLVDFNRSGMFQNHDRAMEELESECARRVFDEVSGAADINGCSVSGAHGISVSWKVKKRYETDNQGFQDQLYIRAMTVVAEWICTPATQSSFIHLLKLFDVRLGKMGHILLSQSLLENKRIHQSLKDDGILHEIPIGKLDSKNFNWESLDSSWSYRSKRPTGTSLGLARDQWGHSLKHGRHIYRALCPWSINARKGDSALIRHFKYWQKVSPGLLITAYVDVRNWGWLFCELIDPDDPTQDGRWDCCIPYHFPSATGHSPPYK